jgi:diguanylate cyclase (GGDEF)-like protein
MSLLAFLLIGAHALLNLSLLQGLSFKALNEGFGVVLPWAFPLLLGWPERGLKTLSGWGRLGATLCIWLGALVWALNPGFVAVWPAKMAQVPGGIKSLSAILAVSALWSLPFSEGCGLRVSWTWALISLGVAFLHGEPWWPVAVSSAPWHVFFSFNALFLLGGLYGLTWRRAYLDELTGLPGRRAFEESLRRLGRRYAIAMVDVDHFKGFNDRYGHQVGDQILRFIAAHLKRVSFGQSFRYGGEEFAVTMPGRRLQGILPLLEDLRRSIESSRFTIRGENRPLQKPPRKARPLGGTEQVGVTVSIGVAWRSRFHTAPEQVLNAADEALYRAKENGRNRVESDRKERRPSDVRRIQCPERRTERMEENRMGEEVEVLSSPVQ